MYQTGLSERWRCPTTSLQTSGSRWRLLLHIQHATCAESFKRVIVASADTDVFICLLYHFNQTWHDSGLDELWVLGGQGNTSRAIPIHDLAVEMPSILVSVLPAVHALTGCDTTSKVSTKYAAFKVAEQGGSDLFKDFGKLEFTNDITQSRNVSIKCSCWLQIWYDGSDSVFSIPS